MGGAVPADGDGASREEQALRAMCHDMRQPLAVIFLLASTLSESAELTPSARAALARITKQTEALVGVVRSTLDQDGEPVEVDVAAVVDEVAEAAQTTWPGEFRCCRWGTDSTVVRGYTVPVRRAVANLVDNAVRAAGAEGQVRVAVRAVEGGVEVVVDDDGPGFGRVPVGAGLGLQIVREVADRHGGSLGFGASRTGGVSARLRLSSARPRVPEPGERGSRDDRRRAATGHDVERRRGGRRLEDRLREVR